jgi:hypothetical protein
MKSTKIISITTIAALIAYPYGNGRLAEIVIPRIAF